MQHGMPGAKTKLSTARVWVWILLAAAMALTALQLPAETSQRARVKDVATIEGIRDNQLMGYGLVVGLRGTGDRLKQRQQHAGEEHGRGLCRRHTAALQPAGFQD